MSSTTKGNLVAFTDPTYYQGLPSLLFNETHYAFQEEVRAFCDEFIKPYVDEWDAKGVIDPQLYIEFGKRGYLCAAAGQHKYPVEYTDVRIKSVPPEKYDFLHETILIDEVARCGSGGVVWFLVGGYNISVPAIFTHATEEVKRKVLPDLLRGTKRSCLCITEPDAGSDVANLTTEAKKGKNAKGEAGYFLSGTKKWITNGFFADYYVVACRTGGKGGKGISLVLAEHNNGFVDRHKIETQGMRGSGSSLINFDELFVPASHILGRENDGFKGIVSNFNHERLAIIYQALRLSRVVIEDCMSWAHQRETFGVKLIEHAVIRQKLGVMSGRVEALQAWVNDLAYQYKTLPPQQAMIKLGGPIATCKAYATQTMELCAREGSQIFGGLSYTRGGKGGRVERIYREVRAFAIPGGSEEIMLDLGIRQSLKTSRANGAKI